MKLGIRLIATIYALMLFISPTHAQDNEELLSRLDHTISTRQERIKLRESANDSLKIRLGVTKNAQLKYKICDELFHSYLHFQADSALKYARMKPLIMHKQLNENCLTEIMINEAEVLGVMGEYSSARKILNSINKEKLDKKMLNYYFRTARACTGWLADFTANPDLKENLYRITQSYRDSIISNSPRNADSEIVRAEKMLYDGKPDTAKKVLKNLLNKKLSGKQQTYAYYTLSEAYGILRQREEQIRYLTLTSISDLKDGTREYAALQQLAVLIYESGDLERAYHYLNCAMEDAVASNARLRSIQVAQIYPIIDKAYKRQQEKEDRNFKILLVSVSFLTFCLLIALFSMYRWMKRALLYGAELENAVKQLKTANSELEEAGRVKEAYIMHYLDRCVAYLDKLESYRNSLAKLARASEIKKLFKLIKSDQFIEDERKDFYREFDKSFLDLFPEYVDRLNSLLRPGEQLEPKSAELLSTELRLFAIIRLGVTDSASIAHFLDCSLTTIYNYRSKVRNKAICKETFEEDIMKL